jgi:hypothetical protein
MKLPGRNFLAAPSQQIGVVLLFMVLMVIPMPAKTMDLTLLRVNGFEFVSKILGGNQSLNLYQQGMNSKNPQQLQGH